MTTMITPHFAWSDIVCPCCQRVMLTDQLWRHMDALEALREQLDFGLIINSGYRCPKHNAAVGSSKNSQHMIFATDVRPAYSGDIRLDNARLETLFDRAEAHGFTGIGRYRTFAHLDMRTGGNARWNG